MTQSKMAYMGLVLAVSIGAILWVNYYIINPQMLMGMPRLETMPPSLPAATRLGRKNLYAGSMEVIKSKYKETKETVRTEAVRNPFLWPVKALVPVAVEPKATGSQTAPEPRRPRQIAELNLTMVLVGDGRNLALINNRYVSEGSRVNGYSVVKIAPGSVLLKGSAGSRRLVLQGDALLQKSRSQNKRVAGKSPDGGGTADPDTQYQDPMEQVLRAYFKQDAKMMKNLKSIIQ